jgi:hypothetical protein
LKRGVKKDRRISDKMTRAATMATMRPMLELEVSDEVLASMTGMVQKTVGDSNSEKDSREERCAYKKMSGQCTEPWDEY